jgi:hypothetical protein
MHSPLNVKFTTKISVLYPGTTVSIYHEYSKYYCTHVHGDMHLTTSIYSSHHLAAKEDVLAASVECPKCLTRSCFLPISKFTQQLTTITTWQQSYSHVIEDPRMLLYISINLLLGDWWVHERGLPGQKPISDVTHWTFVALACSGWPIPLPGKTYNNISIQYREKSCSPWDFSSPASDTLALQSQENSVSKPTACPLWQSLLNLMA